MKSVDPGFVVRVGRDVEGKFEPLLTGILITPRHVITCRHVVERKYREGAVLQVSVVRGDERVALAKAPTFPLEGKVDVALLELARDILQPPAALVEGVTRDFEYELERVRLRAYGYPASDGGEARASRNIYLKGWGPDFYDDPKRPRTFRHAQSPGGAEEGYSGGPALLLYQDRWICMGMLYLGGEGKYITTLYPSDRLLDFLRAKSLSPETVPAHQALDLYVQEREHYVNDLRVRYGNLPLAAQLGAQRREDLAIETALVESDLEWEEREDRNGGELGDQYKQRAVAWDLFGSEQERLLLVLGDPGQDTITLCRSWLLETARRWCQDPRAHPLPIYLPLADLEERARKDRPPAFKNYWGPLFEHYLREPSGRGTARMAEAVRHWLSDQRLWLIDGFDEIRNPQRREAFWTELQVATRARELAGDFWIVITRAAASPGPELPLGWRRVCLADLTDLQAEQILEHWRDQNIGHITDKSCNASTDTDECAAKMTRAQLIASHSQVLDLGVTKRFKALVGRAKARDMLNEAWDDTDTRILILVAEAGVGKTSLVADWLVDFVDASWDGVDAFFDWSFYSQGIRDQGSADSLKFLNAALRHFGETSLAVKPAAAEAKAERLAKCVAGRRTLFVLDGIEPLQHPRKQGDMMGRFKDKGLERLLVQLAQQPCSESGLCVVTTRVSVVDLRLFHKTEEREKGTAKEEELDNLSETEAAELLYQAGARRAGAAEIAPDDGKLKEAVRELRGHALTVQLLGGYLKHAYDGNIECRKLIAWPEVFNTQQERHAWSVMQSYERWFGESGQDGRRQLAFLRLLGLFDRPASKDSLYALCSGKAIAGLTEPLAGLDRYKWNTTLTHLEEEHRLVSLFRVGGRVQVDIHPLVREYFAAQLQQHSPDAWTEGHRRLYEYLRETTVPRPDTLEGLDPLYQAVAHGCQADLHQSAWKDVYLDRILRGTGKSGFYSLRKLGAIGADLGAVTCFFDDPWSEVSPNLLAPDRAALMAFAGVYLRTQGRLTEAVEPMQASVEMAIGQKDWPTASVYAGHMSELELALGAVSKALGHARDSVIFAERSEKPKPGERIKQSLKLADALHQAGQPDKSRRLFEEAEALQAEDQPEYPKLYSVRGFQYCDLLLSGAERAAWQRMADSEFPIPDHKELRDTCDEVTKRAEQTLGGAEQSEIDLHSILRIALDHLTLGRAALYRAHFTAVNESDAGDAARPGLLSIVQHLEKAVDGLRRSGASYYLPRGLLTRAWQRQLSGDAFGAASDLDESWDIAKRGPMPLYQADILLFRARLFGTRHDPDEYPWGSSQADLAEARRLIVKHGYGRRTEELGNAEAALRESAKRHE